ncbi:MAG: hypothetical protein QNK23_10620 [Crocinitomicaceae bacterium]|nr:hypothetical protein [Crocinitomicaceae bacterium]
MKFLPLFFFSALIALAVSCKSHRLISVAPCPVNFGDSAYVEVFYHYKYLKEIPIEEMDQAEIIRLDSLYSFTTLISGHEGWSKNLGKKYNEYYHPEYFVVENPNEFEGKPRNDHDFSLYCPNKLSEMIRLHVNNDLNVEIDAVSVSVTPYKYIYDKKKKEYRPLLQIVAMDTVLLK